MALTREDFDKMAGYEVPDPNRPKSKEVANFATQKEAADFLKDAMRLVGHGVVQGTSDEAIAGIKTGSFSSPEYLTERNSQRGILNQARENVGESVVAPVLEGIGSEGIMTALPVMKGAKVAKSLIGAALSGAGEAPEMEDIPKSALISTGLQAGGEALGPILKAAAFDDSTAILSRMIGTSGKNLKPATYKKTLGAIERLNEAGFFKQGDRFVDPNTQKYIRTKTSLSGFLKPQSLDDLEMVAMNSIASLGEANKQLVKGKFIPEIDFQKAMYAGMQDLTDPSGHNIEGRFTLARKLAEVVEKDMRYATGKGGIKLIPAEIIIERKKALDDFLKSAAFEKQATDLGIDKQAGLAFRGKLDELVDAVGGTSYSKNNNMISDLITVKDIIKKENLKSYIGGKGKSVTAQNLWGRLKDTFDPTSANIVRSDVAGFLETPVGGFSSRTAKKVPSEYFTRDRNHYNIQEDPENQEAPQVPQYDIQGPQQPIPYAPKSTMITPKEIINYRIPRNTQGILDNKEKVVAKLVQNKVPPELIDTIAQALNGDVEDISNITPMIAQQFPNIFERSKYQVFDGIIAPTNRAKAADAIARREDMNSIQRAKAIDGINKSGKFPQELA